MAVRDRLPMATEGLILTTGALHSPYVYKLKGPAPACSGVWMPLHDVRERLKPHRPAIGSETVVSPEKRAFYDKEPWYRYRAIKRHVL